MSTFQSKNPEPIVRRKLLNSSVEAVPPTRFRSWQEQAAPRVQSAEVESAPVTKARRSSRYSLWRNRDFHVVIAFLATAIVAAIVYYTMK